MCPPAAPRWDDVFAAGPAWALVNAYDLGARAAELQQKHPGWSDRQARCSRYWQATARKELEALIEALKEQ